MHLDVALGYMEKLQRCGRLNSVSEGDLLPAIMEAETSTRQSWNEKAIGSPSLGLTDIVALVLGMGSYPEKSRYAPRRNDPGAPHGTFS